MSPSLLVAIAVVVLTSLMAWRQYQRSRPLRVTAITIYPVKSCRGIAVQEAEFTRLGLKYDRQWMIVNMHTGNMATAREWPHMVLIEPSIDEKAQTLTLRYKDHGPLTVPITPPPNDLAVQVWENDLKARRYGAVASRWVTDVLNDTTSTPSANEPPREYHLVSIVSPDEHQRPLNAKHDWNLDTQAADIQTAFSDGYPLLMTSDASLRKLNTWTRPTRDVEMRAFRPNVVVDGGSLEPFDEDAWREVQIGGPENAFWVSKPCERCVLTTVVPDKGVRHPSGEPLISLRQHRKLLPHMPRFKDSVFFGQNLIHRSLGGRIRVGDLVHVKERKSSFFEFAPNYLAKVQPNSEEEKERIDQYGM